MKLLHIQSSFYIDSSRVGENPIFLHVGSMTGRLEKVLNEVYPDCRIYAMEPHPVNFKRLVENTASLNNITCINKALICDNSHTALLRGVDSSCTTYKVKKDERDAIEVEAINLQDLLKEYGIEKIDCMFYNAEGSEMELLPYICSGSIFKKIDQICLNFHTHRGDLGITHEDVEKLINETGIEEIYDINDDRVSQIASRATGLAHSLKYPCFLFTKVKD